MTGRHARLIVLAIIVIEIYRPGVLK